MIFTKWSVTRLRNCSSITNKNCSPFHESKNLSLHLKTLTDSPRERSAHTGTGGRATIQKWLFPHHFFSSPLLDFFTHFIFSFPIFYHSHSFLSHPSLFSLPLFSFPLYHSFISSFSAFTSIKTLSYWPEMCNSEAKYIVYKKDALGSISRVPLHSRKAPLSSYWRY